MYKVKGQLTKHEYYRICFWNYRYYFVITAVLAFFTGLYGMDLRLLLDVSVLARYWEVILYNWLVVFLILLVALVTTIMVVSTLRKGSQLDPKEYVFSEAGVAIRSEIGEERIPWQKVKKLKERKAYTALLFRTGETIHLFDRFFESQDYKRSVLAFVQKRMGEVQ